MFPYCLKTLTCETIVVLTAMALNTNGKPAILLLDMLKCVSLSPMAVIRSERQVLEAALRELAVVG